MYGVMRGARGGEQRRAQSSSPSPARRRARDAPDDGDDGAPDDDALDGRSVSMMDVRGGGGGGGGGDRFKELLEELSAKRGSAREAALGELRKLAVDNYLSDTFEGHVETLVDTLKRNLRRGTAAETKAAAEMLALVFLTAIVSDEARFQDAYAPLEEAIRNSRNPETRSACITSLAVCCFLASEDITSTIACLNLFEDVFTRTSGHPDTTASALDAWGLLATTVSTVTLLSAFGRILKQLSKHLQSDNVDLRLASGETLALLLEAVRGEPSFDERALDEPIEALHVLATDSNKHRARKDRTRQRAAFRDIVRSIEEGQPPEETVRFRGDSITLDTWSAVRRMEALRECLGEGLHVHFKENPIVREIFGLPPPSLENGDVEKMTGAQKRFYLSPNSPAAKARSRWLTQQRRQKPSATQMLL